MRVEIEAGVAVVTLTNPARRNAQDPALWDALRRIGDELPTHVRGVVLQADGPSFSAGLDRSMLQPSDDADRPTLSTFAGLPEQELDHVIARYQQAFAWWRRPDLVSVAAVQGHAVGAGFQLALACDLRIATLDAQFAMREPSLGLVPDLGGTHPLVASVGYARALEICLTGRWIGADEAHSLGLVQAVVDEADVRTTARSLVDTLIAAPRAAAAETKQLLMSAGSTSYDAQRSAERGAQGRILRQLGQQLGQEPEQQHVSRGHDAG